MSSFFSSPLLVFYLSQIHRNLITLSVEGPEAFQPKINCPEINVELFCWGVMGVERWGMHLVSVKSVFWFDFYVIFTFFFCKFDMGV